jgi:hypothetical protein
LGKTSLQITMYTAVKGTYENGVLTFEETPPAVGKSDVVVLFMSEEKLPLGQKGTKGVKMGSLSNRGYRIPDDFNAPLDDLDGYM